MYIIMYTIFAYVLDLIHVLCENQWHLIYSVCEYYV